MASLLCLVCIALYGGYERSVVAFSDVKPWLRLCQGMFAFNILFNLIFRFRATVSGTRPFRWAIDLALMLTLLPWGIPNPHIPVLDWFYSPWCLIIILGVYAAVYLCFAMLRSVGRHTNPALILSTSFLLFIAVGSALLLLPRCTVSGISIIDSIFVSTSAVCICGLTSVNVAATFTPLGMTVIAVLMQVGALGVMTFTSFFALFFSGQTSVYSQLLVKDMMYSKTINSLLPTLLYTLIFTLVVEVIGAAAIYWSVIGSISGYSDGDYILFAIFHAISAFCNAGFSTVDGGMSNPELLRGNQLIYLAISVLVVAGGIGFPILVNAKDALFARMHRLWYRIRGRHYSRVPHLYNLNTRVVLFITTVLFIFTFLAFIFLEWNHSFAGMSPYQKLVQSLFNAVTPRSAGFSSVSPAGFLPVTLLIVMFMMWIGGGSQSTAGGIKVNTFAAAMLHLKAVIIGRRSVKAFNRRIAVESLSRAQAVIALSIVSLLLLSAIMLYLEPDLPVKMVLFESLSALATVGSSLGATSLLSLGGKVAICVAMFVGRVGLLSLLVGFAGNKNEPAIELPQDNLIIN
ncbi:MAG: potassium transporter [Bacteroides sp.]|nr:potassium transporter [Bacteroides sp.]MCM1379491.1 potassium transporter [Bacteroides sp.]MCM1445906.1 potassium transporter [Prevotella sp.]